MCFEAIVDYYGYFTHKTNCAGKRGIVPEVKNTAAIRILAYCLPLEAVEEYLAISEPATRELLKRFWAAVVEQICSIYLRIPTERCISRNFTHSEKRGIPRLLGSIDCCKFRWKNCPTTCYGQYKGNKKNSGHHRSHLGLVAMEIECLLGMPVRLNDINFVELSTLINKIAGGMYPPLFEYVRAGVQCNKLFGFLVESIGRHQCFIDKR